ncbi:transposase [Aequorivita sp. F47161]|uniref:Transposase n=1 Tax=Aequorivita vitellina TaxID=2874475 RepID=A0A9X1QZA1_9FLAO|nr:transposase [Aequorivita vitellina]MCG2420102.1 transposase [Aequorivita vitellina]
MSRKYKFHNPSAAYFVSFAVINWIDVFTREAYFNVIVDSLDFCRKHKGMALFAYCIMPSHIHLLFRDENENPSGLLRDFKGFTSKKMIACIQEHPQESRREWMLWMFKRAGNKNSNITGSQFWQQNNKPIELWSTPVIREKFDYIHNNPVKAGLVTEPWEWKYSSARNYAELDAVIEIDDIGFLG